MNKPKSLQQRMKNIINTKSVANLKPTEWNDIIVRIKERTEKIRERDEEIYLKKETILNLAGIPITKIVKAVNNFQQLHTMADWEEYVFGKEDRVYASYMSFYRLIQLVSEWDMETQSPRDIISSFNSVSTFQCYKGINQQPDTYEAVKEMLDDIEITNKLKAERNLNKVPNNNDQVGDSKTK